MLTDADRNRIAVNTWTARIIPIVLAGVVGYATYVLVVLVCGKSCRHQLSMTATDLISVNYLLAEHDDKSAAVPILVVYFILFFLMTVCFLRLVHITVTDPSYVPLGEAALHERQNNKSGKGRAKAKEDGIAMGEYNSRSSQGGTPETSSEKEHDSPGLELFYTKDVFVCSHDGRPIWCSECCNWYVCEVTALWRRK